MLCLTLTGSTLEEMRELLQRNRPWISLAEVRLDHLTAEELAKAPAFPQTVDLPLILTFRRKRDGGASDITEKERLKALFDASQGPWAYVDIEGDVKKSDLKFKAPNGEGRVDMESDLKSRGVRVIRSHHDFEGVPADIYGRIMRLAKDGAIPKIAVTPQNLMDVISLFRIETELAQIDEKIIVGMGKWGACTRILYKRLGSMLSFVSDNEAAPGQWSARTLSELYRADQVDANTHIYGIIGNPIGQTASPRIHNPGFAAIRYNAIYVPFLVDQVRTFFKLAEMLQIRGFSVTVPHKRSVQPYLGWITREVKQIGSCNTVVRVKNMWKGINTDYYGFLSPIIDRIGDQQIKTALVIGAGGAARTVTWALHNHGVKVTVLNRSIEHARSLAVQTMSNYDSLENADQYNGMDLVVQTTVVGMEEVLNEDPVPNLAFTGNEIAYELVYKPRITPFLERAQKAGCTIIDGTAMLMEQGKLQFEAFSGYHYPHWINVTL
ncbi:MAG: type I 3-dehydroquinate dehydratase [Spirochaetales bacterium]|nr:type I 3-dehydroquinate dehydratase [Spirochaetales bacterium]